jgi:hypothetical protein
VVYIFTRGLLTLVLPRRENEHVFAQKLALTYHSFPIHLRGEMLERLVYVLVQLFGVLLRVAGECAARRRIIKFLVFASNKSIGNVPTLYVSCQQKC